MNIITNTKNKIVRKAASLYTSQGRAEHSLFAVEGARAVSDALSRGARCEFLLLREDTPFEVPTGCAAYCVTDAVFKFVSDTINPQGIFGAFAIPSHRADEERGAIVICDGVRDPGNMGTIIRTLDAVGGGGLILTRGCVDPFNPKVVRSSMSSILSVPIETDAEIATAIARLKKRGVCVAATALGDKTLPLYEAPLEKKCAFIIGSEAEGVSEKAAQLADFCVKIPMRGGAESLNAAVACAVVLYEHLRRNLL